MTPKVDSTDQRDGPAIQRPQLDGWRSLSPTTSAGLAAFLRDARIGRQKGFDIVHTTAGENEKGGAQ
jgi:hypothetical protein